MTWVEIEKSDVVDRTMYDGNDLVTVLNYAMLAPGSTQYLRSSTTDPTPTDGSGFRLHVPHTTLFINISEFIGKRGDLVFALAEHVVGQNLEFTILLELMRRSAASFSLLSDDRVEVIRVLRAKSGGHPYDNPVEDTDLRAAFVDATVDFNKVINQMIADKQLLADGTQLVLAK